MNEQSSSVASGMLPRERRAVGVISLIAVIRMVGLFTMMPVLSVYAGGLQHATPMLIGLAVGGYGLTQSILQIPFGALSDRIGRVPVILFGLVVFAVGSYVAGQSNDIYGVIAGRLLQGAGAIAATFTALLADATRETVRTRGMAILGVAIGGSFFVGLVLGPGIAAIAGIRAVFDVAAVLALVAAGLLAFLPRDIPRPTHVPDRRLSAAFRPDLLRLDAYVFTLHTIMTATFVALPFLLSNGLHVPFSHQVPLYLGAIAVGLVGTVLLILKDERQGKSANVAIAIGLIMAGQVLLVFAGTGVAWAFASLVVYFAGFSFLEAALPARLSIRAAGEVRGASLGVFSSSQFLGAFAGGIVGGRFLSGGNPAAVFIAGAVIGGAWLAFHQLIPEAD